MLTRRERELEEEEEEEEEEESEEIGCGGVYRSIREDVRNLTIYLHIMAKFRNVTK